MNMVDNASDHYLGSRGKAYYESKFGKSMQLGRIWQTRYFRPFCADDRVLLDLGCANGLFLRILPARVRIGIEINPVAREECDAICRAESIPIELHERLNTVESNRVDVVISNHCLEHMVHPYEALKEIRRVLKPGGILVLVTPFDDYRAKANGIWKPGNKDNHLYTWNPVNIGNLLVEAKFSIRNIRLSKAAWSPRIFWVHRYFGDKLFKWACTAYGYFSHRQEVFSLAEKP